MPSSPRASISRSLSLAVTAAVLTPAFDHGGQDGAAAHQRGVGDHALLAGGAVEVVVAGDAVHGRRHAGDDRGVVGVGEGRAPRPRPCRGSRCRGTRRWSAGCRRRGRAGYIPDRSRRSTPPPSAAPASGSACRSRSPATAFLPRSPDQYPISSERERQYGVWVSSPCAEACFGTNEGGGPCVRGLDRLSPTAPAHATADPSRWTHGVGVSEPRSRHITPTRNAIGLSRPTAGAATVAHGRLSPWRSVLPPRSCLGLASAQGEEELAARDQAYPHLLRGSSANARGWGTHFR